MNKVYNPVDPRRAILAFNQGVEAMEQGDSETALENWRRSLELDPGLVPAALNLVTYYQSQGDLEREIEHWNPVIDFDPFNTDHLILQAAALRKTGQYQRAIENYLRAIAIYPYFKFWYHELADIYRKLGDEQQAAQWQERGDSLQADEAEICYEDGIRHAAQGRFDSARKHFEAVLDDFPANLDARLRLAKALEMCQRLEEAEGQLHQAVELTEVAKGLVYFRLGEFYLRHDQSEHAVEAFKRAQATVPRYYRATRALNTLMEHLRREAQKAEPAQTGPLMAGSLGPPVSIPRAQIMRPPDSGIPSAPRKVAFGKSEPRRRPPEKAVAEPRLLEPEDIGMELIEEAPGYRGTGPVFQTLNQHLPWQHQLRQVLDQALAMPDPAGMEPRIALVFEPDATLAGAISVVLSELRSLGRSLRADQQESHILLVQAAGADLMRWQHGVSYGWLGLEEAPSIDPDRWDRKFGPISLGQALQSVRAHGGDRGFNCLLLVSAGRCRHDSYNPREMAQNIPLYAFCFIHPRYHYIDVPLAMQGVVPNYLEITL